MVVGKPKTIKRNSAWFAGAFGKGSAYASDRMAGLSCHAFNVSIELFSLEPVADAGDRRHILQITQVSEHVDA
jgi:hypothetical protein